MQDSTGPQSLGELITRAELAEKFKISRRTLEDWDLHGTGPPKIKLSRGHVRYRVSDVEAWVDARTELPKIK